METEIDAPQDGQGISWRTPAVVSGTGTRCDLSDAQTGHFQSGGKSLGWVPGRIPVREFPLTGSYSKTLQMLHRYSDTTLSHPSRSSVTGYDNCLVILQGT